ncbi:Endonuclease/Exonuclease/phosphatase family protein [Botrimarina colliarenosi]|uniref:Endonuclease/Exonuclease/phosphatase family protein n=1 Tax=Botrimarina colliarenosi TaxID=2528001 RepID=A0A5C6ACA7_9BACT|nr:endonuclease/exonuclease/phosphatase family protein [Botrimarina colliarenosi]TWT96958.1 Endonuclease/Exonuclease/phosphatase family protein [Botrimarina colliarenosi]
MNRVVLYSLALACVCLTRSGVAAADVTPLRIVTFNAEILTAPSVNAGQLQKFRFDYARTGHLERVANVIETLTPDVLNLVEVTSREAVDQVVELLHEKGLDDYRGYHVESNDGFSGMDVGVITRLPLDEVDGEPIRTIYSPKGDPTWSQAFSFTEDGKSRKGGTSLSRNSLYFMSVNGWKIGLLGLHLKSNPDDAYSNGRRTAEAKLVGRAIRGEIVPRGYLPLVLGDLNDYDPDVPDRDDSRSTKTDVIKQIKDFDPDRPGDELVNAAQWIKRKADRYTSHWDWNENGAADGDDVFTAIDHVLLPKELAPYVKRVFISHVVGLDTSDHFPIVVDLELPPAQ